MKTTKKCEICREPAVHTNRKNGNADLCHDCFLQERRQAARITKRENQMSYAKACQIVFAKYPNATTKATHLGGHNMQIVVLSSKRGKALSEPIPVGPKNWHMRIWKAAADAILAGGKK